MTEGPDVPFLEDCGHNDWEDVDYESSRWTETYWERCRVCGLHRTVTVSWLRDEDKVVYWREKY